MKYNQKKKKENVEIFLFIMVMAVFAAVLGVMSLGEKMQPVNQIRKISSGWYYYDNGKRTEVTLPDTIQAEKGEELILYNDGITDLDAGQKITTIGEFLEVIKPLFGREREKKELAKVFQALRIEVNQEMEALKEMLYAATEALKPGGRLVVITYHSLEDRMVKNIMKTGNVEGKMEKDFFGNVQTPFRLVNNKVIVPDDAEIERNPRSRSAKLRIAEKK